MLKPYSASALLIASTGAPADHPSIAFGIEGSGPINTIAATPLPAGTWGFGIQTESIDNDEFSTEELEGFAAAGLEGVHSADKLINTSISASYGVTGNFTISARLPYIKRENIREGELEGGFPEAHTHGDSSGLGDLILAGQYRISKSAGTDISIHAGIKLPTGETNEKDIEGERFETEFQPGSGSKDLLIGASISHQSGKFGYHANILFNKTSEGSQSTEIGDSLSYNVALTYKLNGHDHTSHDHSQNNGADNTSIQWDLMLELNGESRRRNKISSASETHSGGNVMLLSPGIRISSGNISGFLSYGIPVVENQNGKQADIDKRLIAGLSVAF